MRPIYLNAQFHTLSGSGGVGKYIHELCVRARHNATTDFLAILNEPPTPVLPSEVPPPPVFGRFAKNAAKLLLPNSLYTSVKQLNGLRRPPPSKPILEKIHQALPSYAVLHETTNHSTHRELGRLSLKNDFRLCVTFVDIQDYFYPEYFQDDTLLHRRFCYSLFKERADLFFAISHFTKKTMVERLGIPENKIVVTHLAGDPYEIESPSQQTLDLVRSLGRYVVYPAKYWPHKNHAKLLESVANCSDQFAKNDFRLVLTGGFRDDEVESIMSVARNLKIESHVRLLGFLEARTLSHIIKGAEALVFPSVFEGFGMPVLEAMQIGTPILCSNAGSLPEIAGDAALYFDPHNAEGLTDLLDQLAQRRLNTSSLVARGLARSKNFSWRNTFDSTLAGYRQLQ